MQDKTVKTNESIVMEPDGSRSVLVAFRGDRCHAKIVDELTKFRTKTYKAKHIKPYEVFRNVSRDVIASNAPTTLAELKKLNCLDKKTFDLYGEDIVRIVNRVIR